MSTDPPVLFGLWERFVGWLLARTEKFPKRVAGTFRIRIDNLALDVYERLIEARYQRDRGPVPCRASTWTWKSCACSCGWPTTNRCWTLRPFAMPVPS